MKHICKGFLFLSIMLLTISNINAQFYNGLQMNFGKNRVQYTKERIWSLYNWDRFDTYFYQNGRELAVFAARYANASMPIIEKNLEYYLSGRIKFVVFNSLTELKQSNIGLIGDQVYNIGGTTQVVGSTVILYFNGNKSDFQLQIRKGIATVLINQLLYGERISANIISSNLIFLPEWFTEGLINFIAEDWSPELDNVLKNAVFSRRLRKFNQLSTHEAAIAGHSIWHFVKEVYGEQSISNILYMTKISRSVENGFLYVTGTTFKNLIRQWRTFYLNKYQVDIETRTASNIENQLFFRGRKDHKIHQFVIGPDGKTAAFAVDNLNRKSIFLININDKKRTRIFRQGHRVEGITDLSYPLIAWHPRGDVLSFIIEEKGEKFLYFYFVDNQEIEKQKIVGIDKIHSLSYAPNGLTLVVSATSKGQSDIYIYNIAARTFQQLTNDIYDDLQATFVNNGQYIAFSSNRISDTLYNLSYSLEKNSEFPIKSENNNIFLLNVQNPSNNLFRITNLTLGNATQPMRLTANTFHFLSDENGINNRYIARLDSVISHVDTIVHFRYFSEILPASNYQYSIIEHNAQPVGEMASQIVFENNRYNLFLFPLSNIQNLENYSEQLPLTAYKKSVLNEKLKVKQTELVDSVVATTRQGYPITDTTQVEANNFIFRGVRRSSDNRRNPELDDQKTKEDETFFELPKQRNYDVEYFINSLTTQLDYSFLNYSYQPFAGGGPIFSGPGLNTFFKIGINDILEDYRFIGGFRFSFDFNNTEYLFGFENYKYQLDRQFIFHRQSYRHFTPDNIIGNRLNNVHYILKYPFNKVLSLRTSFSLKQHNFEYLSIDYNSLIKPGRTNYWGGVKSELVFDNTRSPQLNIFYGTRFKVWAEYYQLISEEQRNLIVSGFDFRNYTQIHKNFIWANRFAGSNSLGNSRLIYFMGGVDSWIVPRFDDKVNISYDKNYAFQAVATNMRGFKQNIRNGNTFLVFNSELRLPVISYFFNRPLRREFLNNFQIVGFADVGSAWEGWNPFSEDNRLFYHTIVSNPYTITVRRQKNPIVGGLGTGLRTKLLGYFIRTDIAWGIEDGRINKPIFYFSLNMDF